MGRQSIAAKIIEDIKNLKWEDTDLGPYLVIYDWTNPPSNVFYSNLKNLQEYLGHIVRIQASVFKCEGPHRAVAIYRLMKHFNMEAQVYAAKVVEVDELCASDVESPA